jgi:glycosyltransferase involved in cell wall biosynthesis
MNILWLYRYTAHRYYNHWFHTDFAKEIAKEEDINLKMYGYKMEKKEEYNEFLVKKYNKDILMSDLKKEFDFDVVILDCWNRAYTDVYIKQMWLPKDFNEVNVPKICIEGDFHNIKDYNWYSDFKFDMILHRHLTNVHRANNVLSIKNKWLPVSIDNTIFRPNPEIKRDNKICAIGEFKYSAYEYRRNALNILRLHSLIKEKELLKEEKYIECLQSYISHLNCSSIFNLNIAKMFEIMSCGSVLLTDKCEESGIRELFPDNSYVTYNRNYSDLLEKVKKIIEDKDYRDYITNNAIKCIAEKHTHKIRVREFINIIKGEFKIC